MPVYPTPPENRTVSYGREAIKSANRPRSCLSDVPTGHADDHRTALAPWVKARQEQLEAEVRRIWSPTDAATDSACDSPGAVIPRRTDAAAAFSSANRSRLLITIDKSLPRII